ncbi:MAG TPA: ATP-binding protein [Candidatus Obscuribacterales bacterium]
MSAEASNRQRRYRPLIALFGFTVVLVPALLSTLSLFVLDRLWLSTSVAGKAEMSSALTCERMLLYVSYVVMCRGTQLEVANAQRKLALSTAGLSPEQRAKVAQSQAYADEWIHRQIAGLKHFSPGNLDPEGSKHVRTILVSDQSNAAEFPDATAIAYSIYNVSYRSRIHELLEAQLPIFRKEVVDKDGKQSDVADCLNKMERIDRYFEQDMLEQQKLLQNNAEQSASDLAFVNAFSMSKPTLTTLHELYLVSNLFGEFCRRRQEHMSAVEISEHQRQTFSTSIAYGGFIVAICLALFLIVAYARNINSRLIKLVKNAENISAVQHQYESISGNDEIAYVQDVLMDVRSRLDDLSVHRRFIIEMVAHDIRTPIAAANTALALVRGSQVRQSCDIQSIRHELKSTNQFVEKLLLLKQSDLDATSNHDVSTGTRPAKAPLLGSGVFRKMLILVGIPFLLQIGWLGWMSDRLAIKQGIANRQHYIAQRILECGSILELEIHGMSGLGLYMLSGNKQFYDRYSHDRQALRNFQTVIETPGPKTFLWDHNDSKELADVITRLIEKSSEVPSDGIDMQALADKYRSSVSDSLDQLRIMPEKWIEKIARQNAEDTKLLAESEAFSVGVQKWIVAGLFANLAIYALLFLFFIRSIQHRLKVLVANARSLVSSPRQWLIVGGNDELKLLAQALDLARRRLQQATEQRAHMIAQITASISVPLDRSTRAISDMLAAEDAGADQQAVDDLHTSLRAIDQARALVSDLLTLEKLESGDLNLEIRLYATSAVIRESIDLVRALAAFKGISFEERLVSTEFAVDKPRIVQVMVNLLSNAIKFSPTASEITVTCEDAGSMVCISIQDHGSGMDEETARKVFDKFFQSDAGKRAGGFGLGLYICKQIVDLHGGKISATSKSGQGTTFQLNLPRHLP